jgi:hypothetical protein
MNFTFRKKLKKNVAVKITVLFLRNLKNKHGLLQKIKLFLQFLADYRAYKKINGNNRFFLKTEDLYPRIYDKTTHTPLDPIYFYQNAWCAKKIFENKPAHHFDVGSQAEMIGTLSQFTPITMVDIRPLPLSLKNLSFIKGDILNLPFKDSEISSLSSICVIEHIGLGRYGDSLDPFGTEKAAHELSRVLARGGNLYISVPVDDANRVYFNAHRAFTRDYVLEIFNGLTLAEEKYIYGNDMHNAYNPQRGFGTGMYHFIKP